LPGLTRQSIFMIDSFFDGCAGQPAHDKSEFRAWDYRPPSASITALLTAGRTLTYQSSEYVSG
jgi:hypothetical protein